MKIVPLLPRDGSLLIVGIFHARCRHFFQTRMADIVLRLQQVKCALLLRKTTIIKEIRLLESVFPDRASIFSPNLHSNYGNSAPVQFNP